MHDSFIPSASIFCMTASLGNLIFCIIVYFLYFSLVSVSLNDDRFDFLFFVLYGTEDMLVDAFPGPVPDANCIALSKAVIDNAL